MAITYFGSSSSPADNASGSNGNPTITPPASMLTGDLVVVISYNRTNVGGKGVFNLGGQIWHSFTKHTDTLSMKVYWCRFNGTWNGSFSARSTTATTHTVVMHVFRPSDTSKLWEVDTPFTTNTFDAGSSPFTKTITGVSTSGASTVTIAGWVSQDDNTWGSLSGTGWVDFGTAQYRNSNGSQSSSTYAHYISNSPTTTPSVSKNQETLGGDAGMSFTVTFREVDSTPTSLKILSSSSQVAGSHTSPSFTPTAGKRFLVFATAMQNSGTSPDVGTNLTISASTGITFSQLTSMSTPNSWAMGIKCWYSQEIVSSVSTTITVTCPPYSIYGYNLFILEVDGYDVTNAGGIMTSVDNATDALPYTKTLTASPETDSLVVYARAMDDVKSGMEIDGGWSVLNGSFVSEGGGSLDIYCSNTHTSTSISVSTKSLAGLSQNYIDFAFFLPLIPSDITTTVTQTGVANIVRPITYFGSSSNPADGAELANASVTITPPSSMQEGDLVIVTAQRRTTESHIDFSTTGGQYWTQCGLMPVTNSVTSAHWCRFNGTWAANPVVRFNGATCNTVVMHVFRPSSPSKLWEIDVPQPAPPNSFPAGSSPFTKTITGRDVYGASTVTVAAWSTADDNTWGSIAGSGWVVTGDAQYRNLAGSDMSMTFAHNIQTEPTTIDSVSKNQLTLGGDAGATYIITFREVDSLFYKPLLTAYSSGTYGTGSYTPDAFTPTSGRRLIAFAGGLSSTSSAYFDVGTNLTIADSQSLTWETVGHIIDNTNEATSGIRVWVSSVVPSSTSTTVTVDCGSGNIHGYGVHILEVDLPYFTIHGLSMTAPSTSDTQYDKTLTVTPEETDIVVFAGFSDVNSSSAQGITVMAAPMRVTSDIYGQLSNGTTLRASIGTGFLSDTFQVRQYYQSVLSKVDIAFIIRPSFEQVMYSRALMEELPITPDSLQTAYTSQDMDDVSIQDNIRVPVNGEGYLIHQYKKQNESNEIPITVSCTGLATTNAEDNSIYLQIYNHDLDEWETLDTDSETEAYNNFTLSAELNEGLSDYYDVDDVFTVRVYQFTIVQPEPYMFRTYSSKSGSGMYNGSAITTESFTPTEGRRLIAVTYISDNGNANSWTSATISDTQSLTWTLVDELLGEENENYQIGVHVFISTPVDAESMTVTSNFSGGGGINWVGHVAVFEIDAMYDDIVGVSHKYTGNASGGESLTLGAVPEENNLTVLVTYCEVTQGVGAGGLVVTGGGWDNIFDYHLTSSDVPDDSALCGAISVNKTWSSDSISISSLVQTQTGASVYGGVIIGFILAPQSAPPLPYVTWTGVSNFDVSASGTLLTSGGATEGVATSTQTISSDGTGYFELISSSVEPSYITLQLMPSSGSPYSVWPNPTNTVSVIYAGFDTVESGINYNNVWVAEATTPSSSVFKVGFNGVNQPVVWINSTPYFVSNNTYSSGDYVLVASKNEDNTNGAGFIDITHHDSNPELVTWGYTSGAVVATPGRLICSVSSDHGVANTTNSISSTGTGYFQVQLTNPPKSEDATLCLAPASGGPYNGTNITGLLEVRGNSFWINGSYQGEWSSWNYLDVVRIGFDGAGHARVWVNGVVEYTTSSTYSAGEYILVAVSDWNNIAGRGMRDIIVKP